MFASIRSLTAALVLCLAQPALADETVLTLSGAVSQDTPLTFDMAALKDLDATRFETTTIWTEGTQTFEGVSLATLLDHVGAADGTIRATALNDYAVTIPTADAVADGPIIAYARNGDAMSVRDKGPLWIVYPFDDNQTYRTEEYYSRSIWQLDRIEIVANN